jgi:hypothetical protein
VAKVATLAWVGNLANRQNDSGIALRDGALIYAGYTSNSDHDHAWLRRYALATSENTRIVALGIAGYGGCQVQVDHARCAWAGPWAISPDGRRIAYHNPGPTQSITDTGQEKGSPLYLAGSDGTSPVKLFPNAPVGYGFVTPSFSPDGRYITELDASTYSFERLADGKVFTAPTGYRFPEWIQKTGYVILYADPVSGDYRSRPVLYNVETGAKTPLHIGSSRYVWEPAA